MKKHYTFTTARGRVCCSADDLALLCSNCRQAALTTTKSGYSRAPKPYSIALVQQAEKAQGSSRASRAREQADEMNSAAAPKPYTIALAKRAAQGCSR